MDVGRVALRMVVGGLLIGHGTQKLFGWFGGPGRKGTEGMMEALDMHPVKVNAVASGLTEAGSGALLAAGAATPLAAAGVTAVMTTAITKVHAKNGVWSSKGGWEYNAVLIAAAAALAEVGPGRPSLDRAAGLRWYGTGWAVAALVAGAAASGLAIRAGKKLKPRIVAEAAPDTATAES